jgi:Transglycosylase SLT domain
VFLDVIVYLERYTSCAKRTVRISALMRLSLWVLLLLVSSAETQAALMEGPATLCERAIRNAEAIGHTPPVMLAAIGQIESGRPDPGTGGMRPWPWTIDAEGIGQFFATKAQAIAAVAALQDRGVRSIDVGCMQVNLMHHPEAFMSLDQAFDPTSNTIYAVRFLNSLYRRTGSWPKSIAAYHSETPQIAEDYQRRVLAVWQQHAATVVGVAPIYVDKSLIYGAFGSVGRVYGQILPGR